MSTPRVRPQFVRALASEPAAFFVALGERLAVVDTNVRGHILDDGAILRLQESTRHFWSPALYLHLDDDATGSWRVHGRFSPSSPVWTAFVAIYMVLLCAGIAAGSYGGAQIMVGESPWAFWGIPIAIALAAFTHGAAFVGQGLSADDMYELRSFVEELTEPA